MEVFRWSQSNSPPSSPQSSSWPACCRSSWGSRWRCSSSVSASSSANVFDLHSQEWLDFIAAFASIVLPFLAGLEVDPTCFRERFGASVGIGLVSFIGPFVVGSLVAYLALDWTLKAALIAGTALSTTSLAVVYAVLVEDGLNETGLGKFLMSATFVTDLGTAVERGDLV